MPGSLSWCSLGRPQIRVYFQKNSVLQREKNNFLSILLKKRSKSTQKFNTQFPQFQEIKNQLRRIKREGPYWDFNLHWKLFSLRIFGLKKNILFMQGVTLLDHLKKPSIFHSIWNILVQNHILLLVVKLCLLMKQLIQLWKPK